MDEPLIGPMRPGVTKLEVEGEVSLFVEATSRVVVLNTTASAVWRLCDGTRTFGQIVDALASEFRVEATTIAPDVQAAIDELREAGVLPER